MSFERRRFLEYTGMGTIATVGGCTRIFGRKNQRTPGVASEYRLHDDRRDSSNHTGGDGIATELRIKFQTGWGRVAATWDACSGHIEK